jgi:iron complex outermembrane receptor protein
MDVRRATGLKGLSACLLLAFAASPAMGQVGAECTRDAPPLPFNIPGGDWGTAVVTLHEQDPELALLYDPAVVPRFVRVNAVIGTFNVCEAVARLFAHTGLIAQFNTDKKLWVSYRPPPRSEKEPSQGPRMRHVALDTQALEQVLVTGSLIRGVQNLTAPLQTIDRQDLDSASFGTLQDVLHSLPIDFRGGATAVYDPQGAVGINGDFNGGESVNLRGLGAGATLVLVDGYRQPAAGFGGDFVDISQIPWSAVERIEVLPDGASALYGADAIAGVVNIIMRKDLDGAQSQLRFGTTPRGDQETLADQLFGTRWDTGKLLLAYQFSHHTALADADRVYSMSSDKTPLGGTDYRSVESNPGNILDPYTQQPVLAIPRGSNGTALMASNLLSQVVNLQNQLTRVDLLPNATQHNFYGTASQAIGEGTELFVQARVSRQEVNRQQPAKAEMLVVPVTNPFNPLRESPFTLVGYSFLNDLGPIMVEGTTLSYIGTAGLKLNLGHHWGGTVSASFGRERTDTDLNNAVNPVALGAALADSNLLTAFNPFGDGSHTSATTLATIRDVQRFRATSDLANLNVVADGPLFSLPTGDARVALGGALRRESLDRSEQMSGQSLSGRFGRTIASAYTELAVPLVGDPSHPHAPPRLELSLAARQEHYSDVGSTINPKVGLRWTVSDQVKLRSSWGTSFRAPNLVDLYDTTTNAAGLVVVSDPHSATGQSLVLVQQGNNPQLGDETASTWTAGIDFAPGVIPDLTLSLTYFGIDYRNQIFQPEAPLTLEQLLSDPKWTTLVTRNPSSAQVAAICNSSAFIGSPGQCAATPPQVLIDGRLRNLSRTRVSGLDWQAQKSFRTDYGRFNLRIEGSDLFTYRQAVTPLAPAVSVLNTDGNPVALRFNALVDWSQHASGPGFGARLTLDYTSAYRDVSVVPKQSINAWAVTNFTARYRTGAGDGWSDGLEIALNAANLFNRAPPFVNRWIGYDPTNADSLGRVLSVQIRKSW